MTIDPPPAARSAGTARRAQWNIASRSIFRVRLSASGVTSSTRAVGPAIPALFTSTSSPPSAATAASTKPSQPSTVSISAVMEG